MSFSIINNNHTYQVNHNLFSNIYFYLDILQLNLTVRAFFLHTVISFLNIHVLGVLQLKTSSYGNFLTINCHMWIF